MQVLLKDWRGTPMEPGSIIVYPGRHSSSMWMVEAEILQIIQEPEYSWGGQLVWKVQVQPLRQGTYSRESKTPVKLKALERITVLRGPLKNRDKVTV